MRNPSRIKDMMSILTEIWEMYPDLRFNQLIHALEVDFKIGDSAREMYFVEDDEFLEFLQSYYHELQTQQ